MGPGHPGLSAGQQHIVALARAELIQPAVMLLDEATAHLSDEEEETVIAALRAAAQGRTALIVAHKLKTAQTADRRNWNARGVGGTKWGVRAIVASNGQHRFEHDSGIRRNVDRRSSQKNYTHKNDTQCHLT